MKTTSHVTNDRGGEAKIEALLKRCRRQTSEIERDHKDWEERNKAVKAEQECQQRKSQQTQPEPSETSGEGSSTSILKVKSQKGKTVEIMQVEVDKPENLRKSCTNQALRSGTNQKGRTNQGKKMNQLSKKRLKMKVTHHPLSLKTKCMNSCRSQR